MIIGITGTYAAGKDTVAEYLVAKGFNHYSLSDEIRQIMTELGLEETRENLIATGNKVRIEKGNEHLATRVTKKLQRPAVITSIRNPHEIKHLKTQEGFVLLHVDADREIRYARTVLRLRQGDLKTLEEFVASEEKELKGAAHSQNLTLCFEEADHVIYNNGEIEELHIQVEEVLQKLKK